MTQNLKELFEKSSENMDKFYSDKLKEKKYCKTCYSKQHFRYEFGSGINVIPKQYVIFRQEICLTCNNTVLYTQNYLDQANEFWKKNLEPNTFLILKDIYGFDYISEKEKQEIISKWKLENFKQVFINN